MRQLAILLSYDTVYFNMERRIDLSHPENWTKNQAPNVARQLGYVLNGRFVNAVREYGKSLRREHERNILKVLDFVPVFGNRFLSEYKPPLKRIGR